MGVITVDESRIREVVTMADAIAAVREAFRAYAEGSYDLPPRTALHDGAFLVMAAHHRPSGSAVTKTLSLTTARAPAIVGAIAWTDLARTDTLAIDAAPVTSLRTGAVVGVATDLLAPRSAGRMVLFGAGGQSADQVRAVHAVRPLRSLHVLTRRPGPAEELLGVLTQELTGVTLTAGPLPEHRKGAPSREALAAADLVCCATPATAPLFAADDLAERVHVNAVGSYRPSMRELPVALLAGSRVYVDSIEAALEESGEVIDAVGAGALCSGDLTELGPALLPGSPGGTGGGEVAGGGRMVASGDSRTVTSGGGRTVTSGGGRTVFKSVGLAIQDWAIADLLARRLLPD